MIKDIVVALLTTTINRYSDSNNWLAKGMVIKDLTGILDYVAYLKENKESSSNNYEIIEKLQNEIKDLKEDRLIWQETCIKLRKELEKYEEVR